MSSALTTVREVLTRNIRQSGIFIAFVAIIILFAFLTGGTLLTPQNVNNIVVPTLNSTLSKIVHSGRIRSVRKRS